MKAFVFLRLFMLAAFTFNPAIETAIEAASKQPKKKTYRKPDFKPQTCHDYFSRIGLQKVSIYLYSRVIERNPEDRLTATVWVQLKDPNNRNQRQTVEARYSPKHFQNLLTQLDLKTIELFRDPDDSTQAYFVLEGKAKDIIALLDDPMILLAGPAFEEMLPVPEGLTKVPHRGPHPIRKFSSSDAPKRTSRP